jgi:hypothetical protein
MNDDITALWLALAQIYAQAFENDDETPVAQGYRQVWESLPDNTRDAYYDNL